MQGIDWNGARVLALTAPLGTIERVVVARSFGARCIGLLARSALSHGEGMLFVPGGGIHTFGMRFALDVVFLGERFAALAVAEGVPPWRCISAPRGTHFVLELLAHTACDFGIVRGSSLVPVANRKQLTHRDRA